MSTVSEETRTLEIRTSREGTFRIDIPVGWKVTFSRVNPQSGHDSLALRVYEAEDKQRACFTGVESFRDISIPIRRREKKVKASASSERDHKGSKSTQQAEVEYEWVDGPADETGWRDDTSPF